MQKIYTVEQPKIHLSEVIGYDPENKVYYLSDKPDIIFDNEEELIKFLARVHRQVVNWNGKPIRGEFRNKYMENQALNGLSRKSRYENAIEGATEVNLDWKVNNFLFWFDTPEQSIIDVRVFKKEVDATFFSIPKNISHIEWNCSIMASIKSRQGRAKHKFYTWRRDSRYIHRARAAYGMEAEEEYKEFAKAKDKEFKSVWPDEDFGGYHSTGWKDNSGNRYRHQWEARENRRFEKIKRKKDIAMFSGKKLAGWNARKTTEELDAELEELRKEFGC